MSIALLPLPTTHELQAHHKASSRAPASLSPRKAFDAEWTEAEVDITMYCQKCRTPLKLDGSLEDLNPAAYDLLVGEDLVHSPHPFPVLPF